jgi:hypothetical protein
VSFEPTLLEDDYKRGARRARKKVALVLLSFGLLAGGCAVKVASKFGAIAIPTPTDRVRLALMKRELGTLELPAALTFLDSHESRSKKPFEDRWKSPSRTIRYVSTASVKDTLLIGAEALQAKGFQLGDVSCYVGTVRVGQLSVTSDPDTAVLIGSRQHKGWRVYGWVTANRDARRTTLEFRLRAPGRQGDPFDNQQVPLVAGLRADVC